LRDRRTDLRQHRIQPVQEQEWSYNQWSYKLSVDYTRIIDRKSHLEPEENLVTFKTAVRIKEGASASSSFN